MSIEALASYVLDEIALDGDYGTSIPKLFEYVGHFYHNHRQRRFGIARLCEPGPAVISNDELDTEEVLDNPSFFPTQALDIELRKEIWKRLASDADFYVGKNNEGKQLGLEEVEEGYTRDRSDATKTEGQAGSGIVDEVNTEDTELVDNGPVTVQAEGEGITGVVEDDIKATKIKKWKVYASTERRWKALTGHGAGQKKIPPKFFDLLTEIGRHREKGILQPTLTKVTNQDARSVGPRTTALANMGYIEKVNVLAAKLRTSKLTLQSYATLRDLKEKRLRKKAQEAGTKADKTSANAPWTGDTVDVRKMVEAIFAELRKAKNKVLMHSDIKRKLGMDKSRFHFRAFARIIRRVEKTGCLKRIRVPLKLTRQKKNRSAAPGFTDKCLARCIKLIREPNEYDWEQTLSVTLKRTADDADDENVEAGNDGDEDGEKDGDQVDDDIDDDAVVKLENAEGELVEESSRIIPSWVPDRSLENIVYDAVDAAGMDGVSSMDLHQIVAGRFYYRPLDQVLRRLGDNPIKSQPPHLLRLAIIRETDIEGRHTHYRYFSYRWHEKLVKAGLGKAVGGSKKAHIKGKKRQEKQPEQVEEVAPKRVTVATDDLGFSFVDKRRLLKGDASATLKESQQKLAAPESAQVLKSKYTIETTEDGKSSVIWANWNRIQKGGSGSVGASRKNSDGNFVRSGRLPKDLATSGKRSVDDVEGGGIPTPQQKRAKFDENGVPLPPKPRGRPRKPDHLLKNPRKPRKYIPRVPRVNEQNASPTPDEFVLAEELAEDISPAADQLEPLNIHAALSIENAAQLDIEMTDAVSTATGHVVPEVIQPVPFTEPSLETIKTPLSHSTTELPSRIMVGEAVYAEETPALETPLTETPVPKRRGRPPKNKNPTQVPSTMILGDVISAEKAPVPETPVSETPAPKRRGRPPKNRIPAESTPKDAKDGKMADIPAPKKITEFFQAKSVVPPPSREAGVDNRSNIRSETVVPNPQMQEEVAFTPRTRAAKARIVTQSAPKTPQIPMGIEKHIDVIDIEMADASSTQENSPAVQEVPGDSLFVSSSTTDDLLQRQSIGSSSKPFRHTQKITDTWQREKLRPSPFSASVDATEEVIVSTSPTTPIPESAPNDDATSPTLPSSSPEATPTKITSSTTEGALIPVLKGRMYRNKPATKFRLPRSEPTMVLEEIDDTPKMSYGSAGGMLMIARQRVILELMEENGGVFPGGLEIKHAFESRYKRKNPKAGQPDRRLMVSLVSSLQRSGKINQIVINFINSRGLRQTKRILTDSKLPLDHPLILEMKNHIVAADGNLWFPEGTEIPKEAQKLASSVRGLPTQPGAIESVEFERMYVPQRQILKAQRAEAARHKRLARIEREHAFPRFTAEQKELAAKRLEYRRRRAALNAMANRVDRVERAGDDAWNAPTDNENEREQPIHSCWWRDLVDRPDVHALSQIRNFVPAPVLGSTVVHHPPVDIPDPSKEADFEEGIRKVYLWETTQLVDDEELHAYFGFNMINHFSPGPDTAGTDYAPERASMSQLIYQPDFRKGRGNMFTGKKYGPRKKAALNALDMAEGVPKPKRRRIKGPRQKRTRREKAMAELHHGAAEMDEDATLEEVPQKSQIIPRKRHLFDYEQDDVLLAAIVIVRTLFGGFDRRIDWTLVATAFPEHDMTTLKARWPRVRDAHKTHLKKLQIDFEEVYLDAYERGEMPEITRGEIDNFDLPWHCRWFKENVTVPDAKSVPSLTQSREVFDSLYDLRAEKPSWRDEYHNPALTGSHRTNFMTSHTYEVQMFETKTDHRPYEDPEMDVECIKSLIKANILTDIGVYDARKAFEMLSSYSVEKVDTAFYFLTGNKTLAPKKDAEKLVPGRNYEFTERFHLSMRVPVGGRMWVQAVQFQTLMDEEFSSTSTSNTTWEGKGRLTEHQQQLATTSSSSSSPSSSSSQNNELPTMSLSPFMNDGSMMVLLNLVATRRITLDKSRYVADINGLISGYRTRSMEKAMIDFPISIHPTPMYYQNRPTITTLPPPVPNSSDWQREPVKLWYDIMGNLVSGMWRKCVAAVLGTIVTRPGLRDAEIVRVLWPAMTVGEVEVVTRWLENAGMLERRQVYGRGGEGCWANFVNEGFWWGLGRDKEKLSLEG